MQISSPRLRRLDGALSALPVDSDAMLLSDLDGYVAGVILSPEDIPSEMWLPPVWGDDAEPPFADAQEAAWYAGLVTGHHDATMRMLDKGPGRYAPFFETDARHDEVMWELWIEGFDAAMALRPEGWDRIGESGDAAATEALAGMVTLATIARNESDLERDVIDTLTEAAPALIAQWVDTLHAWRRRQATAPVPSNPAPAKVGRNDPCPCGSGRKSKKCCA